MSSTSDPKPLAGTVAPVEVQPWYKHATIIVTSAISSIPVVILALQQLTTLGLSAKQEAWIAAAISVLTAIFVAYQKITGVPLVTPTAAAKLIQTTSSATTTESQNAKNPTN